MEELLFYLVDGDDDRSAGERESEARRKKSAGWSKTGKKKKKTQRLVSHGQKSGSADWTGICYLLL